MKTPKTAEALRQLKLDKQRYGVHQCCGCVATGPHSIDCPVEHPGPYYFSSGETP